MPLTNENDRRKREYDLLVIVKEHTKDDRACLSKKQIADLLSVTGSQTSYTLASLVDAGLIAIEERFLPNGGRLENAYSLTPIAHRLLSYIKIKDEDR